MAGLGSLVVELSANIAKFESAMSRANYVANQSSRQISNSMKGMQASFDAIPGSIAKIAGAAAALSGIAYIFAKGIKAADEFKMSVIGIAAGLTNIAKPGQGSFEEIFKRNLAFATEMAEELERVAAKTPAEANELMMAYNQLVQQGYALRVQEADAMGVVVTRIKLATQGQDANRQINQEIRALMQGQAVAGSMLALELQTRLGPAWADIVNQHKKAGDLMKFLADLWPGVGVAGEEFEKTLQAQGTTLMSLLKYVGRQGLAGAYDDIVGIVKSINDYLRQHGTELAGNIQTAWAAIKDIAGGVVAIVSEIVGWLRTGWSLLQGWRDSLSAIAKQRSDMGVGLGLDLGPGLGMVVNEETDILGKVVENQKLAKEAAEYKKQTFALYQKSIGPPAVSAPTLGGGKGGGGKGGGGAEAAANRLENFIKTMEEQTAKASGDSLAALDAWYDKQIETLNQIEVKTGESLAAREALQAAYNSKREALEEDYNLFIAKESGNAYVEIEAQAKSWLTKYQGFADAEENIAIIKNRKIWDQQAKDYEEQQNLIKGYYDSLAQVSPELATQLGYQERSLAIESELAFLKIDQLQNEYKISEAMADEMRGMQALVNQAKEYNLEREKWKTGGIGGGLLMGAYDLSKTAETWQAEQISSWIKGAPKEISTYLAQNFIDGIKTGKIDLQATFIDLGYATAQTILQKFIEGWLNQLLPLIANSLANIFSGIGGGGGGGGFFGQIFGSLFGGMGGAFESIGYVPGMGYHSGGIVKAHGGLAVDEIPAILQTGERVLSRSQNAAYERGTQVNVTVINNSKAQVEPQVSNQGNEIRIMLEDAIEQSIRGGKGYRAIRQTFNLNPTTVGRQ